MDKTKLVFILIGVLVLGISCLGIAGNMAAPDKIDPSEDSIHMVQPCGWVWCSEYDRQYAEHVNLPNSTANKNNAEANRANAEATAVVSETWQQDAKTFGEGAIVGLIWAAIPAIVVVFLIVGIAAFLINAAHG